MSTSIYDMTEPTSWVKPTRFSHSSLTQLEHCPLQWQLSRSAWGEFTEFPSRPHPASVEGDIVHGTLDDLFRALSLAGCPPLGSQGFRAALKEFDLPGTIAQRISAHQDALEAHPRGAGFALRKSARQLQNKVIRFFREQYSKLDTSVALPRVGSAGSRAPSGKALSTLLKSRGALSEIHLYHPSLPFHGIIDLVWLDNGQPVILDFKTGKVRDHHREQVRQYAVLWWRCSGELPARAEVRYPGQLIAEPLTASVLQKAENELTKQLARLDKQLANPPAKACLGEHCQLCDVRQFCDAFWAQRSSQKLKPAPGRSWSYVDIEVTVASTVSPFGFEARTSAGETISVVYPQGGVDLHGPFAEGMVLRILSGGLDDKNKSIKLTERSEVFRRL